jgi:hypothetical protein
MTLSQIVTAVHEAVLSSARAARRSEEAPLPDPIARLLRTWRELLSPRRVRCGELAWPGQSRMNGSLCLMETIWPLVLRRAAV